ncbi:hypothetical protein BAUCODRAFT_33002 [Baudoinia panamericana UAMH 10762]|uniref:Uncharacterized protein n=1 Tax=Baudoinia panamericana (strain UAMH 10762) TaxID=717646 RepID=M2N019_BAUPA|nr:uncharacterized protein BAUCODRAFT_33002 [Baudoinia panamericana UAMH 10762]EMC97258.1 hypothetical protein BAUCODRAFT_33002 [Baudoinia panamericana UAMH 10762]
MSRLSQKELAKKSRTTVRQLLDGSYPAPVVRTRRTKATHECNAQAERGAARKSRVLVGSLLSDATVNWSLPTLSDLRNSCLSAQLYCLLRYMC